MTKKSTKLVLTELVLEQLPEKVRLTADQALKAWWLNFRKDGGLRLSDAGDLAFRTADFEYFDFDFSITEGWAKYMLEMSKKMPCPYYINVKKEKDKKPEPYVRIYDSRIAVLINLYGSFNRYIQSIKVRNL